LRLLLIWEFIVRKRCAVVVCEQGAVMEKNSKIIFGAAGGLALVGGLALLASRRPSYSFKDKTVLIVGGSRGLGLVMARQFAADGARVAICARDAAELERAREDVSSFGGRVMDIVCDARQQSEIVRTVGKVHARFGPVDVLVNNAGIIRVGPLELQTRQDFEEAMQIHFWAPYFATQAVLPEMKRRGTGRIVNIASIGGKVAVPHLASYCASKFALVGLSSAMRTELVRHGIYVTTVCPGLMRTGSHINAEFKGQKEIEFAMFSVLDGLPITSVSAESAAQQILNAVRRGDAELTISPQAKLAVRFQALFPNTTARIFEFVSSFLPGPGTTDKTAYTGLESQSAVSPSIVTSLIDEAAERNNELKPKRQIIH
jgi:NAD(P)-dependent dehydrogenase (short-subunit alcohol dehydrogenase family)